MGRLARAFPRTRFVHVVHPNPNVRDRVRASDPPANVERIEPLDYRSFLRLLRRCRLVLSDSGGIQEEAPAFGKRVLVLREKTERPEGIEAGFARLVGTDEQRIFEEAARILSDRSDLGAPPGAGNPYGDGRAAGKAVSDASTNASPSPTSKANGKSEALRGTVKHNSTAPASHALKGPNAAGSSGTSDPNQSNKGGSGDAGKAHSGSGAGHSGKDG